MVRVRLLVGVLIAGLAVSPPAHGYEAGIVKDGGSVSGTVKFAGTPPKLEPVRVIKNQEFCGRSKPNEALVVGGGKGVRGAVVWIEGIAAGKRFEGKTLVLDNTTCVFVPHVLVTFLDQKALVVNSDDVLHNVNALGANPFNLALPNKGQQIDITKRLRRTGVSELKCNAHVHMRGWMITLDHPYVAVTDANGHFAIDNVPAGRHRLTMWHEPWVERGRDRDGRPAYGPPVTVTREVTVAANGTTSVEFELK
jgi:hypothetical protein